MEHPYSKIVIQKYGGSSVATIEKLEAIAHRVVQKQRDGFGVVVVVSAMGNTTDNLLKLCAQITDAPPPRELDMLLSTGERTTMALLSIAIQKFGAQSISFTGSQSGIITTDSHSNARIISVRPYRIQDELDKNKIVIVAGFQGTSYKNEITTLGRGGSDMTAIALAGALNAEACEIYSDVSGVYSADPKVVLDAKKIDELSSAEMLELAQHGAKVLHDDAILYAQRHQIALYAKKSMSNEEGSFIRPDGWPKFALENAKIKPIAVISAKKLLYVNVNASKEVLDNVASAILSRNDFKTLNSVRNATSFSGLFDVWNCNSMHTFLPQMEKNCEHACDYSLRTDVKNVSLIGLDIGRHPHVLTQAIDILDNEKIRVLQIFTEPNALTFVIDENDAESATRHLHTLID